MTVVSTSINQTNLDISPDIHKLQNYNTYASIRTGKISKSLETKNSG